MPLRSWFLTVPRTLVKLDRMERRFDRTFVPLVRVRLGPEAADRVSRECRTYAIRVGLFVEQYAEILDSDWDVVAALTMGCLAPLYDDRFDVDQAAAAELRALGQFLAGGPRPTRRAELDLFVELFALLQERVPRAEHPGTYRSIERLHAAQERSVQQLGAQALAPQELRAITVEKGLAATRLFICLCSEAERDLDERYMHQLGEFLQLMDDYDDQDRDAEQGVRTLFNEGQLGGADLLGALAGVSRSIYERYGWDNEGAHRFCAGLAAWALWLVLRESSGTTAFVRDFEQSRIWLLRVIGMLG